MRFDDRLQTLLDASVTGSHDRAVRWRQLVDLLSRLDANDASDLVTRALELVRSDVAAIDEEVRGATVRAIAGRRINVALLRIFAREPLRIAAPLFAGLTLTPEDAASILADAAPELRALVTVSPPLETAPFVPEFAEPPLKPLRAHSERSIGDMVSRIEQLTRERAGAEPRRTPPERPSTHRYDRLFQWESDASGHIAWVEGAPRGALVGRPLGGEEDGMIAPRGTARIDHHHPFDDVPLGLGELLAGEWSASGVPAFDPSNGRFLGYRGLARRLDGVAGNDAKAPTASDPNALRELVHEIRTPLNAIIGFAEIIDGQYLGPAHHSYRERAAQIVGQARLLLDAIEDLDLAARLRADRLPNGEGGRLADLLPPIAVELEDCLRAGGGMLELDVDDQRRRCALSPELTGRLLRRLLLSLCQHVEENEPFRIASSSTQHLCLLLIGRPRRLEGFSDAELLDPAFHSGESDDAATIGLGFTLRLVRGLARVAGGDLIIGAQRITLQLPALGS